MVRTSGSCELRTSGAKSTPGPEGGSRPRHCERGSGRPRMRTRAFLDSNVFIFGFERPKSNCHRILELLVAGGNQGGGAGRVGHQQKGDFFQKQRQETAAPL